MLTLLVESGVALTCYFVPVAASTSSAVPPAASMEGYVKDEDSNQALSKINNISKYIGKYLVNFLFQDTSQSCELAAGQNLIHKNGHEHIQWLS